jgi:hypothetical protein
MLLFQLLCVVFCIFCLIAGTETLFGNIKPDTLPHTCEKDFNAFKKYTDSLWKQSREGKIFTKDYFEDPIYKDIFNQK